MSENPPPEPWSPPPGDDAEPTPSFVKPPPPAPPAPSFGPVGQAPTRALALRQVSRFALVMPQRGHIFRRVMENAAAMNGVTLDVRWELSSVPAILDLVAAGIGHAALGEEAARSSEHRGQLVTTPFTDSGIHCTLCLVTPTQKRHTPLMKATTALLGRLLGDFSDPPAAEPGTSGSRSSAR